MWQSSRKREPSAAGVVAVFGSSQTKPSDTDYAEALRCGRLLAEAGFDVATGGYGGTMEAVSRGAADARGTVIAVTAPLLFPDRSGANEWAHIEQPQPTLSLRIAQLIDSSAATIALPGSIGTLTELIVAWNDSFIQRLGARPIRPVIAVGQRWSALVAHIASEIDQTLDLVTCVDGVDQAVAVVLERTRSQ